MLYHRTVKTKYNLVSLMYKNDSSGVVTVTKNDDESYFLKMYSLSSLALTFEEELSGSYIKVKEVAQSADNQIYVVVFNDDGVFKMRSFGNKSRTKDEIKNSEVNLNTLLSLNNWTMCNHEIPDPNITCCFIEPKKIFINLYHNHTCTHYHFIYDLDKNAISGDITSK